MKDNTTYNIYIYIYLQRTYEIFCKIKDSEESHGEKVTLAAPINDPAFNCTSLPLTTIVSSCKRALSDAKLAIEISPRKKSEVTVINKSLIIRDPEGTSSSNATVNCNDPLQSKRKSNFLFARSLRATEGVTVAGRFNRATFSSRDSYSYLYYRDSRGSLQWNDRKTRQADLRFARRGIDGCARANEPRDKGKPLTEGRTFPAFSDH